MAPLIGLYVLSQTQELKTVQIDDKFIVRARRANQRINERVTVFEGDVEAVYGVTKVRADRLTVYLAPVDKSSTPSADEGQRAIAEGNVELDDPEGQISAARLEFSWVRQTGRANDVAVMVADMEARAETLNIRPGEWEFLNVTVEPCEEGRVDLKMPKLTIRPGKDSVATRPELRYNGKKILSSRRYVMSLDRRSRGMQLPSITEKKGVGYGIGWMTDKVINDQTFFTAGFNSFPKRKLAVNLQLTRSFISPEIARGFVSPRSDAGDIYSSGYFENIDVLSPDSERTVVSSPRLSASVGSFWGIRRGNEEQQTINKPWELTVEGSRGFGQTGLYGQLRFHRIGDASISYQNRVVGIATAVLPNINLSDNLRIVTRLDGRGHMNEGPDHGWLRGQVGVVYSPNDRFGIGAAYANSVESGNPVYRLDELDIPESYHVRANLTLGPTTLRSLVKYDPRKLGWYDHEYYVEQLMGCFETYLMFRERPNLVVLGFRFRPFEKADKLKDRTLKRLPGNNLPEKPKRP